MVFYLFPFVALGLLLAMLFVLKFYLNIKNKCAGFPFDHFVPSLFFDYVTGKIPKDISMNSVIFQRVIQQVIKHAKEGLVMTFITRPVLLIFSEEAIKKFANEKAAIDKPPSYRILEECLGAGLVTSSGDRWKTHRKMINVAFNMCMLKEKFYMFNEHALALIKDLEKLVDNPYVDLSGSLKEHYFNSLCESVFGLKQTKENKIRILRLGVCVDIGSELTIQRMFSPWLYPKFLLPLFPTGRLFNQTAKEIDDIICNILSEVKTYLNSSKPTNAGQFGNNLRKSLAYILLNQHLNDPLFTFKDVQDETKTILLAGYDTVSWATVWCLFLLGLHPDIQEKAFDEMMSTTSDFISYEEVCNLKYLNAVILETLRLYPAAPIYGRNLTKDVRFGDYKVSKDTTIAFFPYILHRNSNIYSDPEKFEPERFLNGESQNSGNFMPFAEGNRTCIGKNFALLEMKIFLGHILRNFQIISLDKRDDVSLAWGIVMTPEKPLRMKIIQRHTSFS